MNIYVMTNGFVVCGEPQEARTTATIVLDNCGVIRRYGTQQGLGQLAASGPLPETVIDSDPDGTTINMLYVMRVLPCNEAAWNNWIAGRSESKRTSGRSAARS